MNDNPSPTAGTVYLVGAGPGDPSLITVAAVRALAQADVIVFDALANAELLSYARADVELIDAGKRAKQHKLTQDETNALLAEHALAGRTVVRLKGGDPYVFGRGSEEAMYLHSRGVRAVVIPGITAAMAGPAYAGIPVTHRNVATTVTFITGHENPTKGELQTDYRGLSLLAQRGGTLCFYMGMGRLSGIVDELHRHGLPLDTPAAVVQWGTLPRQRSVRAAMSDLQDAVERAGLGAPAIIVIGPVAAVDKEGALRWFEDRPLFGQRVVITRTRHQASTLKEELEMLGAEVLEAPTIEIQPTTEMGPIDAAIRNVKQYDWLILTSANGVTALRERMALLKLDARHLAGVKIAAVGDTTVAALEQIGIGADLVPTRYVAESLASDLLERESMQGKRVLMLRADIARPLLREKLEQAGATVADLPIYETRQPTGLPANVVEALESDAVDWVTFTSSSTVRNFVELLGEKRDLLAKTKLASIGPITSQTIRDLGLEPTLEAEEHNVQGLVAALRA
ncbi:MAG: uroporphyrinogen-III C-methyltransferase [Phycisphaeraceae bacterium]